MVKTLFIALCMGAGFWLLYARQWGRALIFFGIAVVTTGNMIDDIVLTVLGAAMCLVGIVVTIITILRARRHEH